MKAMYLKTPGKEGDTAMKLVKHTSSKMEYVGYEDGMNTVVLDIKE